MNFSSWIPIFLLVFILYDMARTARRSAGARHAAKLRRRKGAEPVMEEIIQKLMGRLPCSIAIILQHFGTDAVDGSKFQLPCQL